MSQLIPYKSSNGTMILIGILDVKLLTQKKHGPKKMDLNTIDQVIKRATHTWNSAMRNEIIHVRHNNSDIIFLQGAAAPYWWQATIIIGSRGGIKGEFITMDPSKEILCDQLTCAVAPGGQSIGPMHVPRGAKGIQQKVKAAKSVLNQLLSKSKDEADFTHQIAKYRGGANQSLGGRSVRSLRG